MAVKSEHVQSTTEHDSSLDRTSVEKPQAFDGPSFDLASEAVLKATPPDLDGQAAVLRRLRGETRERLMMQFQQSFGNRYIQRVMDRVHSADQPADDLAQRIQAASSDGGALDASTRERLQASLGVDLSSVRVHLDDEADRLSESVEAIAFTTGNDIFFRKGMYQPETATGLRLLAHEAAHTLQQASGPVEGTPWDGGVSISDPTDGFERAADQAAEQVVSGQQAAPLAAAVGAAASTNVQRCGATPCGCPDEEDEMPLQRWSEAGLGSPVSIQRQDDDEEWYGDGSDGVTLPEVDIVGDPNAPIELDPVEIGPEDDESGGVTLPEVDIVGDPNAPIELDPVEIGPEDDESGGVTLPEVDIVGDPNAPIELDPVEIGPEDDESGGVTLPEVDIVGDPNAPIELDPVEIGPEDDESGGVTLPEVDIVGDPNAPIELDPVEIGPEDDESGGGPTEMDTGGAGGAGPSGGTDQDNYQGAEGHPDNGPVPPYHPSEVPSLPPDYVYRVVSANGLLGTCAVTWAPVFHPTAGGSPVISPDPNYEPLRRPLPPPIVGAGTISQLPGKESICFPRPITDEDGNVWTSGPVPVVDVTPQMPAPVLGSPYSSW